MWPKHITNPAQADEWYSTLMGNLIFYRKEAGIRQEGIAKALGVTRPQISNMETVRSRITAKQIDLWCKACGISVTDVWPQP